MILEETGWALGTCVTSDRIKFSLVAVGDDWNGERERKERREEEEEKRWAVKIS